MGSRHLLALLLAVVVVAAAVASGVTYALVRHDSPAAHAAQPPIAFVGVLRDTSGKPVANASLQLTATYLPPDMKDGDSARVHPLASTTTDAAGRFTLRQTPSVPVIRKMAAANGGWVNLEMDIRLGSQWMPWGIPRKIGRNGWLAEDNPNLSAALKEERLTFKPLGN